MQEVYCSSKISINKEWDKERKYFNDLHNEILDIYHSIESIIDLHKKKQNILSKYNDSNFSSALEELTTYKKNLESTLNYINSKVKEIEYEIMLLSLGLFAKIHAFFNTRRYRNFIQENLRLTRLKNEQLQLEEQTKVEISKIQSQIKTLQLTISQVKGIEQSLIHPTEFLKSKNFDAKIFEKDGFWDTPHDNLHQTTPYFNEEFEILRSKLFVQAIKLHEIFINANAEHFWSSLNLFSDLMNGKLINVDPEIAQIAWKNFFIIIPIVSTTFHSFDNMFKSFNHNDIAWLIIDEAGQAPPQYAAAAIYKSKNVIVVGDPMQTQPISILGQELINKLCQKLGISYNHWSPSEVSVQHLADRNSLYQTKYGNITVGFPLLVHRRCQDPMFSICNNIAYNNKMIFAANNSESDIQLILGNSRWINIEDNGPVKLKYESEAEFGVLFKMIKVILKQQNAIKLLREIYIITMYRRFSYYIKNRLSQEVSKLFPNNCDQKLRKGVSYFCKNNIGTIHSFQGKEADSVIILLGAQHPEDYGARKIMTDKSNVLNVGISRAKNNLYIIGNKLIWLPHTHMNEIYDAMLLVNK